MINDYFNFMINILIENFMKRKIKLSVITIALCAISVLNTKIVSKAENQWDDLLLMSMDAIGRYETGRDDETCSTSSNGELSTQNCRGVTMNARITITHSCKGGGIGLCFDGVEYYFYDCEGAVIKHDQYVTSKSCN